MLGPGAGRRVSRARFITKHDPRWACHNTIELTSFGADDDFLGIGSSPHTGDYTGTALTIPAAPTVSPENRYLFRLCGIEIPSGASVVIHGLRQLILLVAPIP